MPGRAPHAAVRFHPAPLASKWSAEERALVLEWAPQPAREPALEPVLRAREWEARVTARWFSPPRFWLPPRAVGLWRTPRRLLCSRAVSAAPAPGLTVLWRSLPTNSRRCPARTRPRGAPGSVGGLCCDPPSPSRAGLAGGRIRRAPDKLRPNRAPVSQPVRDLAGLRRGARVSLARPRAPGRDTPRRA